MGTGLEDLKDGDVRWHPNRIQIEKSLFVSKSNKKQVVTEVHSNFTGQ
jgi:hypothetical protein